MRRELFVHFSFLLSFFILITLFKRWFDLSFWPFWIGGLVGTLLPDIDHFLYVYNNPQELTSQRVNYQVGKREIWSTLDLLAATRNERAGLIFHTAFFQLIFVILTFWVISSSGSLFGRGLVLAFSLHLVIDQFTDLMQTGALTNWFSQINFPPIGQDKTKLTFYWIANLLALVVFGFAL